MKTALQEMGVAVADKRKGRQVGDPIDYADWADPKDPKTKYYQAMRKLADGQFGTDQTLLQKLRKG
jgi:hypothetical protein